MMDYGVPLQAAFAGSTSVRVKVISDQDVILKEYPLMHAVTRCANTVERHRVRRL